MNPRLKWIKRELKLSFFFLNLVFLIKKSIEKFKQI